MQSRRILALGLGVLCLAGPLSVAQAANKTESSEDEIFGTLGIKLDNTSKIPDKAVNDDLTCGSAGSLTLASADILNACGGHFRGIVYDTRIAAGAMHLCTKACNDAINKVMDDAYLCTDTELDAILGAGARAALNTAQQAQIKCSPPSTKCMLTYAKLHRWEMSAFGQQCRININAVYTSANSQTVQKHTQVYCESKNCGGAMNGYLQALEDHGCAQWAAYQVKRVEYDRSCLRAGTTYCASVASPVKYIPSLRAIAASSETDDKLDQRKKDMCTPCFFEYLRMLNRFAPGEPQTMGLRKMEKMCMQDNGRFCYSRYRKRERATIELGRNAKDAMLCKDSTMGHCALKMDMRDTPARVEADYMCLRRIAKGTTSANQPLCAELMKPIVGGYDFQGVYLGARYSAPAACSNLKAIDQECTWGCQKAYTPERESFGCCYDTTKTYYSLTKHEAVDLIFNRSDLIGLECNRPSDESCELVNLKGGVRATINVDVPVGFLRRNQTGTYAALITDIERAVGQTRKGLQIRGFRYQSSVSSAVDFIVFDQNDARATMLVDEFKLREEKRENVNFNIDRLFWFYNFKGHSDDTF